MIAFLLGIKVEIEIKGYRVLIDDEDWERVSKQKWRTRVKKDRVYFMARDYYGVNKYYNITLHRMVTNAPKGLMVDHKDNDTLNNCKSNLRICTNTENVRNSHRSESNTSGYKGVHFHKQHQKWNARITVNRKRIELGLFDCPTAAWLAYCRAAVKYHGEFARFG